MSNRLLLSLFLLVAPALAWGEATHITKDGVSDIIHCQGEVVVDASNTNLVVENDCGALRLHGSNNNVRIAVVEEIHLTGSNNNVAWTRTRGGKRPRIVDGGKSNVVVAAKGRPAGSGSVSSGRDAIKADSEGVDIGGGAVRAGTDGTVEIGGVSVRGSPGRGSGRSAQDPDGAAPAPRGSKAKGKQLAITRDGQQAALRCDGHDVVVDGDDNTLHISGTCQSLRVNGDDNTVVVDATHEIAVVGEDNEIAWRHTIDGRSPRISTTGENSDVTRASE